MSKLVWAAITAILSAICISTPGVAADDLRAASHWEDFVIAKMETRFQHQMNNLQVLHSIREYSASNGLLRVPAYWKVSETYRSPGQRLLSVIERRAPAYLDDLLLKPIMEAEVETAKEGMRQVTDITRHNYQFEYLRHDLKLNAYVFRLEPRTAQKYLFRGLIWIDEEDFAIKRIEGSPARKPSIWVRESHFVHKFHKFDDQWFPVHHHSEAQLRMFGTATLDVKYSQYNLKKKEGADR